MGQLNFASTVNVRREIRERQSRFVVRFYSRWHIAAPGFVGANEG